LMISKNYRFHVTGLAVMAIAFVLRIVLQAIYPG
jgi:hypothetical protein